MTIASAYGRRLGVDNTTCGLLGMAAFIVVTSGPENGIDVANFSANGLFVAMVVSLLATKVYSWFILNGFTIKMPEMVPPQIGNSFAAIVPYAAVLGVCWIIRTLLNIDLIYNLQTVLDVEAFAIGGGISAAPAFGRTLASEVARIYESTYAKRLGLTAPKLLTCQYRNEANLVGALYHHINNKGEE